MSKDAIELCQDLIRRPSITPDDQGCQDLIAEQLTQVGFQRQSLNCGEVSNTWLRLGTQAPLLVLAGHTDVVPAGDLDEWQTDPFVPTIKGEYLYGRGASDMKASVAAMVSSAHHVAEKYQDRLRGSLALLLTSDEEGPGIDGTRYACTQLAQQGIKFDHCLIGEPTCREKLGDVLKIGRRGSLSGLLTIKGKQGHIAYPHLAHNPIHDLLSKLKDLVTQPLDEGTADFDPSSLQFSSLTAGVAGNVIPGKVQARFNIRFNPQHTEEGLKKIIEQRLEDSGVDGSVQWQDNPSLPFLSRQRTLADMLSQIIEKTNGQKPLHNTEGGTSDGRFIHQYCDDLLEFGPVNKTIHQINECVGLAEIVELEDIYTQLITQAIVDVG